MQKKEKKKRKKRKEEGRKEGRKEERKKILRFTSDKNLNFQVSTGRHFPRLSLSLCLCLSVSVSVSLSTESLAWNSICRIDWSQLRNSR